MKKLQIIIMCVLCATLNAQVTVTTVTGQFKGSGGLSLDGSGNLYIGDFGDFLGMPDPDGQPNHIMKLDTNSMLTQFATDFIGASGNDFDSSGVLHQSDIRDNAIYNIVGGVRTFVTSTGIVAPVGIVFDSNDNFFVCNCGDGTIQKVTPSGTSNTFASGSLFNCPNGITIDENDNLYVANFSNTDIVKITPNGDATSIANTPLGNGHLDYDLTSGKLYIASYHGQQIFSLNVNDPVLRLIAGTGTRGNDDGPALTATFSTPNGVAVSDDGNSLYVNCAVPLSGVTINPQVIRLITGLNSLSVDDNTALVFNVKTYPNPSNGLITIESDLASDYENLSIIIYDILGNQIMEISDISTSEKQLKQTIDVTILATGNYLYTISSGSKQLFNGKIIKE